ncbi:MAG: formylglycine-generating enzyme family protein [Anaerolineae bacterium]|nr:formylglycine-generating enzyme family protein [Anaerolineae bacterium]
MKRTIIFLLLIVWVVAACSDESDTEPPAFETGIDVEAWALIPAGEFLMGLHSDETMVDYAYEMMITDVTNTQYAAYLNAALVDGTIKFVEADDEIVGYYPGDVFQGYSHEEPIEAGDWLHIPVGEKGLRLEFDGTAFTVEAGYENHPMVQVTWFGAQAYCEFYGWQLPTEIEWEKAARGTEGRPYPWGDEIERNNANFYSSRDLYEKIVGKQGITTPVGFYNGLTYDGYETLDSPSPYGLYDMAGNVWQWTGNIYEDQHYRYMRGGSKAEYEYNLRVWTRNNATPEYHSINVGFRCARDAPE